MEKFWMVWVEGTGSPTRKYTSLEAAQLEAARLATKETKRAFIFAPIATCVPQLLVAWEQPPVDIMREHESEGVLV